MQVELGEYDLTGPKEQMATMTRKVKRVVVHRDYKAPTFENDIAILELEKAIDRKPHIVPICMPQLTDEFEGRTGIVSGWGRLKYGMSFHLPLSLHSKQHYLDPCSDCTTGGNVPNVLHQVSVPIMNNTKCQTMFTNSGHKKTVRESFLCAGYDEGKKDSCEVSEKKLNSGFRRGMRINPLVRVTVAAP